MSNNKDTQDNQDNSSIHTRQEALIDLRNISKSFGGVHAVENVSLKLYPGEVVVNGQRAQIGTPADSQALGVETIYQTLALADNLDSVANLFLGRERGVPPAQSELQEHPGARAHAQGVGGGHFPDLARHA